MTLIIVFAVASITCISILGNSLDAAKAERDAAVMVVGNLSRAYKDHLSAEYKRTMCGIEESKYAGWTTKDYDCFSSAVTRARTEVEEAMKLKK